MIFTVVSPIDFDWYLKVQYCTSDLNPEAEFLDVIGTNREMVFMERPLEPNLGPSLADVLLCTFESTNAGFSSFSVRKLLS